MTKKLLVGALQYSPIYKSLCCALGKQAKRQGFESVYLFNKSYEWLFSDNFEKETYYVGNSKGLFSSLIDGLNPLTVYNLLKIIRREKPDYVYMYNIHPTFNYILAKLSKKYKYKYIQHIHEPYSEDKKIFGGLSQYILPLFEAIQGLIIFNSSIIVVSSQRAMDLFKKRYNRYYGELIKIPLMCEDLGENLFDYGKREYITFVGPLIPVKNPELFFKIVRYCEELDRSYQFQLISRVEKDCSKLSYRSLKTICGENISDKRYGELINQSKIIIYPHKSPTQSSVVFTSFMYGIPVIASDLEGFRESISQKKTGYLVNLDSPIQDWVDGIEFILTHYDEMVVNCREYFLTNYSEINWPKYFGIIFGHS